MLLIIILILIFFPQVQVSSQTNVSFDEINVYTNIEDAMKNPDKVYRLDLSNQQFEKLPSFSVFTNLEYLSLRNDHLKEFPEGIGKLRKLKTLDLSGNDFLVLPDELRNLINLEELYLNDEKNLDFNQTFDVLKELPELQMLHLDNDYIRKIPSSINQLNKLEALYLNHNLLKDLPLTVNTLGRLKYLEVKGNKFPYSKIRKYEGFGVRVIF